MEKIEKLIRLLYLEGYEDGKKQKKTPYKYTADSDKGKELYDYVEKQLDKAREEGRKEGLVENLDKRNSEGGLTILESLMVSKLKDNK